MYVSVPWLGGFPPNRPSPGIPSKSSSPSPPSSVSLPLPPISTSLPEPPWITSSPSPPSIGLSLPGPASITLGPFQSFQLSFMSPRSTRSRGGTGQAASPHCGQPCVWFAAAQPAGSELVSMYAPQSMMWMHGVTTGPQVVSYGEVSTMPLLVSPLAAV